jgi:hypothetical protein
MVGQGFWGGRWNALADLFRRGKGAALAFWRHGGGRGRRAGERQTLFDISSPNI